MAGIYWNETEGLISLSSDGESWITIADKNLGATQVYNDGDTLTAENSGGFFQWGNNHMFAFTGPTSSEIVDSSYSVDASNYGPGNYYDAAYFVLGDVNKNWDNSKNTNLRGDDTNTNEARRGPCSEGFHIPSKDEIVALKNAGIALGIISASDGSGTKTYFKIPMSGFVYPANGTISNRGTYSGLRSSYRSYYDGTIYESSSSESLGATGRASVWGGVIRPFKNEPEIPDYNDVWDTLYGDELPDRPAPVPVKKLKWLMNKGNFYYFDEAPTHASSVTLNESSITLTTAGQTYQLTATVSPDDAVIKKVNWSSSDLTVATVTQTGLVTCVTPGECTITATCDGVSATCSVEDIKEAYVEYIVVGGGGGGGSMMHSGYDCIGGGGGGGGDVCAGYITLVGSTSITIGAGGASGCNGGDTTFGDIIAKGGCAGMTNYSACPSCKSGGNSGKGCLGGYLSGSVQYASSGGGGGGAAGVGGNGTATRCSNWGCWQGGNGGLGKCGYGGGGGGGMPVSTTDTTSYGGKGCCGGGDGGTYNNNNSNGCPATKYGGGGGGGGCYNSQGVGGAGCKGVVFVCYLTSCGYDVTGGTKYTCGDYTVHRFTSDGTLTVN